MNARHSKSARRGRLALAVLAPLALALASGCRGEEAPRAISTATSQDPSSPLRGHVYTGVAEEPDDLGPFTTKSSVARRYLLPLVVETLADLDPDTAALRPALAESWEVAADGSSMRVRLRRGIAFHDGSPVTRDDALFAFELSRAKGVVLGSMVEGLSLCRSVEPDPDDAYAFRVHFAERHFAAPKTVLESWVVVPRAHWLARLSAQAEREGAPYRGLDDERTGELLTRLSQSPGPGTGPYRFFDGDAEAPSWRKGVDVTLFRHDASWRCRVPGEWNFAAVRLRFLADPATRFAALKRGELDWYSAPELQKLLDGDADLAGRYVRLVYDTPSLGAFVVQWNAKQPQLRDARVRTALARLFDREAIATKLFGGLATPAACFGKPGRPGTPADLAVPTFDPAVARAELKAAGFDPDQGTPLRLRLLVPVEAPWYRRIGELFVAAAATAGVEVDLRVLVFQELMNRREAGDWDAVMVLQSMPGDGDLYELFHQGALRNVGGYANASVDRLLEGIRVEPDAVRRYEALADAHRLMASDPPLAVLVHPRVEVLVDRRLQNAQPTAIGLWPGRMWMPKAAQRQP